MLKQLIFYTYSYIVLTPFKTRSLIIINIFCLCLGAFVAILSGLSGLGLIHTIGKKY